MALYDSGGLDGDINWSSVDLPYMWQAISGHESSPYTPALDGWRKSYELVLMHRTRVEAYKDKLIQAWPPERNKAARAYIDRLDHLVESLTETYDAAVANYTTFSSAISAVAAAKTNMQPLQEQYEQNKAMLAQYEADPQNRPANFTPPQNPAPDNRQENLRQQAAVIMTSLSAELAAAQTSLVSPKPYSPLLKRGEGDESSLPDGTGFTIPTSTPVATPGRSTVRLRPSKSVISHPDTQKSVTTPNPTKTGNPTKPSAPSSGPILGGTKPTTNSPITGTPTSPAASTSPSSGTSGSYHLTPSNGAASSTLLPRSPAANGTPTGGLPPATGSAGSRGLPGQQGNVIGGNPALGGPGSGRGSHPGTAARSGPRTSPVGGVIGQDGSPRPGQRRSTRDSEESDRRRWDPNNPWETNNGVDPILLPAQEQRIDPGPSIGGR